MDKIYIYCSNNPVMYKQRPTYQVEKALKKIGLNGLYILSFDYKKNHGNPNRGILGSIGRIFYPDGRSKQEREYGPDGKPIVDHDHDWDWDKKPPRQPAREPN